MLLLIFRSWDFTYKLLFRLARLQGPGCLMLDKLDPSLDPKQAKQKVIGNALECIKC